MNTSVKEIGKTELKKSFYLLTRQLTEIETAFTVQIQSQFSEELTQHHELIVTTCQLLDVLDDAKNE